MSQADPYLVVQDLSVTFPTADGPVRAVRELSFTVDRGATLGIVGESGSGKSAAALALLGLHDARRTRVSGSVRLAGRELVGLGDDAMRRLRGDEVAMVFQDPLTALHPFYPVGAQIAEAHRAHRQVSRAQARAKAVEMLARVGIAQPRSRADDYPHQLSGGMRQRAMIAMALVNEPALLIADEPTTALDVTVQAQVLDLLLELRSDVGAAVVLITHDLGVVAETVEEVLVMYGGRAVEHGPTREVLTAPRMPYTWSLLRSVPDVHGDPADRLTPVPGSPPSLLAPPPGCPFEPRCPFVERVPGRLCRTELPALRPAPGPGGVPGSAGHLTRCHLPVPEEVLAP